MKNSSRKIGAALAAAGLLGTMGAGAAVAVLGETLAPLVEDGTLTQEQADSVAQTLMEARAERGPGESGPGMSLPGHGGPGMGGPGKGDPGQMQDQQEQSS
ncbi:MAG: hypothetical protein WA892_01580 [Ornithinimicrobium sp.]